MRIGSISGSSDFYKTENLTIMKLHHVVLFAAIIGLFATSCKKEPEFECTKNAPVAILGKQYCAFAKVKRYVAPDTTIGAPEQINIGINYGGFFSIGIVTSEIIAGETYTSPGSYTNKADLQYEDYYTAGDGYIRVTKMDRANRLISGEFDLSASNAEKAVIQINGSFTDVPY